MDSGRTRQSLDRLNGLVSGLTATARENFGARQWLELARAPRVVALEKIGETERASAEAADLSAELDPGLLPGILVREVLLRTAGTSPNR